MLSFDSIWDLVKNHGGVAEFYITDAARLWETYSEPQREHIYRAIQNKLAAGKFVHYNPVKAFIENAPKPPRQLVISAEEYYRRYNTQANRDGWQRVFLKDQGKTIYVKQLN